MVYIFKEFPDITLQYPTSLRVILAYLQKERPESPYRFMPRLIYPAGERIRDESSIKERIENSIDGVME